jgi:hypothetical protein
MAMWGFMQRKMLSMAMAMLLLIVTVQVNSARADLADALDQLPPEAQVVIVVPNLASLNQKIAALKTALNLPVPELEDAVGALKREMGMVQGVDDNGAALIIIQNITDQVTKGVDPQMLIMVPVTDYGAFVGNYGGTTGADITPLTIMGTGSGFGKQVGNYALMAELEQTVENYAPANAGEAFAQKFGPLGQQYLGSEDILVLVDLEKLGPVVTPLVDNAIAEMKQQFEHLVEAEMMDAATAESMSSIYEVYGSAAKAVLKDANGLLLGLDLADEGVGLAKVFHYKPESVMAELFPGGSSDAAATLQQLPQQPYIFAAAFDAKAVAVGKLYEKLIAALPDPKNNPMVAGYEHWLPMVDQVKSMATALYAPSEAGMMSGAMLNSLSIIQTEDAAAYVESFRKYLTAINATSVGMPAATGPGQATQPAVTYTTSFTPNALQIEGVKIDQYQLQLTYSPQMMQQMGPLAPVIMMFGGSGYSGYIAADGNHVLMTTVTDPQLISRGLQGLKGKAGLGTSPQIRQLQQSALPAQPVMESYLSLDGMAEAANAFMPMFGAPPIVVPDDVPPVAMGMSIADQSIAARMYIPTRTVQFAIDTVQGLMASMGGGGQAPGTRPGAGPRPGEPMPPPFY